MTPPSDPAVPSPLPPPSPPPPVHPGAEASAGDLPADAVLAVAATWRAAGRPVALATVIASWEGAPWPVGRQMAFAAGGDRVGSMAGGGIEAVVAQQAQAAWETDEPRRLCFTVSPAEAAAMGLAHGGKVSVWIEPLEA